jgi:AhpD family alkylhydroperoxidase
MKCLLPVPAVEEWLMSGVNLATVLGPVALTQVRYVSPVRRGSAQDLVGRVYAQLEQDFGVLAPPVALHSPAPQILASSWMMVREVLVVTGSAGRTAKEAVATAVSLANTCPYCFTVHSATFSGLSGNTVQAVADPQLLAIVTWARESGTGEGAAPHEPEWSAEQAAELVGTAVLLHYFNRMVNVFLTEVPLPPGVPKMMLGPVMWVVDRRIRAAAGQPHRPGASLALLPAASLPSDLFWAAGNPVVADAFARAAATVDAAGARSVPPSVRDVVMAELGNWRGERPGPSRAWADDALSRLPRADRPAGRLALLTALASYQVDRRVIDDFRSGGASDAALVELASWASFTAARRVGAWISAGVRDKSAADGP